MKQIKKSRATEIKEMFAEHVAEGGCGIWLWCYLACIKAQRAAEDPNDVEAAREFKRWMRVLRAYLISPESYQNGKITPTKLAQLFTSEDAIRARALGIRLE